MMLRDPETFGITASALRDAREALLTAHKAGKLILDSDSLKAEGITISTGLTAIDLQPGALRLFPYLTPLRNQIPRAAGNGATQHLIRAITSLNQGQYRAGVPDKRRNRLATTSVKNFNVKYAVLDTEDEFDWTAREAGEGQIDIQATTALGVLQRHFMLQERIMLGGNRTLALGQVQNVAAVLNNTGGSIAHDTDNKIAVVALTLQGFADAGFSGDATATDTGFTVVDAVDSAFGNPFNVEGFSGQLSGITDVPIGATGLTTHSIDVTWDAIPGAVAYAIFVGQTNLAGMKLYAIANFNSYRVKLGLGLSPMLANTTGLDSDKSRNVLEYDGIISITAGSGQGSSADDMFAGTPDVTSGASTSVQATGSGGAGVGFHSNGSGGIIEFDTVLKRIYEGSRGAGTKGPKISVDEIFMSSTDIQDATDVVLSGGNAPLWRLNMDRGTGETSVGSVQTAQGLVTSGVVLVGYISRWGYNGPKGVKVSIHPDLPQGTVLFVTYTLPYQQSGIQNILTVRTRRDVFNVIWPQNEAAQAMSIRCSEVLECQAAFALGAITNMGIIVA